MNEQPENKTEPHLCNYVNEQRLMEKSEQPNQELMIVKTIQSLTTCVENELGKLNMQTAMDDSKQSKLIAKALEEIDLFEKTTLYELQKAFE